MQETQIIPEIAPMRRGRPGKPQSQHESSKPSPSPYRSSPKTSSDPFAALDGSKGKSADELSNRFPSLEQFDILHEKGDKFDFEPSGQEPKSDEDELSQRLTNALADDAFARRSSPERQESVPNPRSQSSPVRAARPQEAAARPTAPLYQPSPQRPTMVSTGTMTSPAQTPRLEQKPSRPIYRFPPSDEQRPASQPWTQEEQKRAPSPSSSGLRPEASPRLSSDRLSHHSSSARPSMEALRRPSTLDVKEPAARSRSAVGKARPISVQSGARYDLPQESSATRSSLEYQRYEGGAPLRSVRTDLDRDYDQANISSNMDYLRAKEEEESNRKREKRSSSGAKHSKRSSLSTLSFSGGKTLFAGRFGDAFRRFESSNQDKPGTPPVEDELSQQPITAESPNSPSENFSPYHDDPMDDDLERDDVSPEMRRELERRRLSQEEKRVANAAAEYRRRVAEDGSGRAGGDGLRSQVIQNRVQSLLAGGDNQKPAVPKTATGYGKYTDTGALQAKQGVQSTSTGPLPASRTAGPAYSTRETTAIPPPDRSQGASAPAGTPQAVANSSTARPAPSRPTAPPKPKNLRVGVQDTSRPGSSTASARSPSFQQSPGGGSVDDWEARFSQRFPSLSGMEMETEIEVAKYPKLRTREV